MSTPAPISDLVATDRSPAAAVSRPESEEERKIWDDPSRRTQKAAEGFARSLLQRLAVPAGQLAALAKDERFNRALLLWAMEFPLNIAWYDRKIGPKQWSLAIWRGLSLAFGLAAVAATTVLAFTNRSVSLTQLGVLAAGAFGALQLIAASSDPKAQLGGFRKARADLKESMFTFVEVWRGRSTVVAEALPAAAVPSPDFMTALYQEIRTGRKIAREERETYFATFKSATEILSVANSALDGIRGRRAELMSAVSESGAAEAAHAATVASRIQDLRNRLADAVAQRDALVDEKRRLTEDKASANDLAAVQAKIEAAETDRFKTQRLLDLAVKGDVANPI